MTGAAGQQNIGQVAYAVQCWLTLLVCCAALLHTVQGAGDAPVKVFDRTPNLSGAQIISYRISPDTKWCVLIGITQGPPER